MMFFVSHNVPENKALPGGADDTKKVRGMQENGRCGTVSTGAGHVGMPVHTAAAAVVAQRTCDTLYCDYRHIRVSPPELRSDVQ
jgi:hypothetical protein